MKTTGFISGFVVTGFVLAFLLLSIALLTFDPGGGETLRELEVHRIMVLAFTLLLVFIAGWIAREYTRSNKRFTAYGIRVMALICLAVVTVNYLYNLTIPTSFNKTKWEQSELKPYHMAATLVKRHTLMGLTTQEVNNLLGQGSEQNINTEGSGYMDYTVEDSWSLTVYFERGKVKETEMRLPWLGI